MRGTLVLLEYFPTTKPYYIKTTPYFQFFIQYNNTFSNELCSFQWGVGSETKEFKDGVGTVMRMLDKEHGNGPGKLMRSTYKPGSQ